MCMQREVVNIWRVDWNGRNMIRPVLSAGSVLWFIDVLADGQASLVFIRRVQWF